jgi:CRP-like cAMP-binding protein
MERPNNTLLRAMAADDWERLRPQLRETELRIGDLVATPGDAVERVVWVETGLLSIVYSSAEGQSVETSMVGREGAGNLLEACGSGISYLTVLVQVEGRGFSVSAAACRDLFERSAPFRAQVVRYGEAQMAEGRQSVVCQAMHEVEGRCARWILEASDRGGIQGPLPLTQEYLAAMLGVQRTTVTPIAAALQRRGLIRYSRGRMDVLDAAGLERVACVCRRSVAEHRARVSGAP